MNEHEIERLATAIAAKTANHPCVFDKAQIATLNKFTDALSNGGWKRFQALLDFGSSILLFRKTVFATTVTLAVGGVVALLVLGVQRWILSIPSSP